MKKIDKLFALSICCALLFLVSACDVINPEEEIPAYIELESLDVSVTGGQGTANDRVTEGWVFVDKILIGAFTEGKPFPVLESGMNEVLVDAGIHENGITSATELYPFLTRYTTNVDLIPGEVTKITPVFEYRDNVTFVFIEDFTDNHIFGIDRDNNLNTELITSTDGAFEGASGLITLNSDNRIGEFATVFTYADLPINSFNQVFLELDYKIDIGVNIGVIAIDNYGIEQAFYSHGLNSKNEWNKVYLNLSEVLNSTNQAEYRISFLSVLPQDLDEAELRFDNIKLIHFAQ